MVLLVAAAGVGGAVLGRDTAHSTRPSPVVHYNASPYWPLASQTFMGVYQGEQVTAFLPQGIPFGWPHTERGAIAAAAEILKVSMSAVVFGAAPGFQQRVQRYFAHPGAGAGHLGSDCTQRGLGHRQRAAQSNVSSDARLAARLQGRVGHS